MIEFQESTETIESNRLDQDLRRGVSPQDLFGQLEAFKTNHWKGRLFWIPGGKTVGGDVGFPIEIIMLFYPNPWVIPQNAFAVAADGTRLTFRQLLQHYDSKRPNDGNPRYDRSTP